MKFYLIGLVLLSACNQVSNPLTPSNLEAPILVEVQTPIPVQVKSLEVEVNPYTLTEHRFTSSQYIAEVTIRNFSQKVLNWLLAVFDTPVSNGHPEFFKRQRLYLESLRDITVNPGQSVVVRTVTPDYCDAEWQADLYEGVWSEDIRTGDINIHPLAIPKVYEVEHHFGKSRTECLRIVPPVIVPSKPVPVPLPPVEEPPIPYVPPVVPCIHDDPKYCQ